jgi:putative addiction module CopG family antidote
MVIHVPADLEASIRERVESGEYPDETEVIRTALRALAAREQRIEEIRASIAEGLAEIERGEGYEWTPELMEEISREADEQIRLGRLPKPDVCP